MAKRRTVEELFRLRINRFSPILCRILARHKGGRPLSVDEICARSGLPAASVVEMSHLPDWDNVTMRAFLGFTRGCGIDLLDSGSVRRVEAYLKRKPTFRYLRRSPDWKTVYRPLIDEWRFWAGLKARSE